MYYGERRGTGKMSCYQNEKVCFRLKHHQQADLILCPCSSPSLLKSICDEAHGEESIHWIKVLKSHYICTSWLSEEVRNCDRYTYTWRSELCFRFSRVIPIISILHSAIQMDSKQLVILMPQNNFHSSYHKIFFSFSTSFSPSCSWILMSVVVLSRKQSAILGIEIFRWL